ncbi:MAG: hypothetical protein Q8R01_14845 [Ramlibacter sp.]|nr:hypothetical protein [Ramlibacter sp.]
MNTTATGHSTAPQTPVSAASRVVTAVAVAAVMAIAWIGAEQASHQAVQTATEAFSRSQTHVTLPAVQVVGRRDASALKRI